MSVNRNINKTVEVFGDILLALFFTHCLVKKFEVHIVTDRFHMTVLLCAHNIARTTQFKITHCNAEAAAEFCKFPDCGKPFLLNLRENLVPSEGKVGICPS